jgi:hypothetical protein
VFPSDKCEALCAGHARAEAVPRARRHARRGVVGCEDSCALILGLSRGRAFGLELGFPTFVAVMVAANLAVAVPVALWNFGPYETLVAGVLIAGGVTETTALSYALTVHLLANLWIDVTGLAAFAALGVSPRELFTLAAAPAGKSRDPQ